MHALTPDRTEVVGRRDLGHRADDDEGLGTVYERFVLNDLLLGYRESLGFASALEAPVYGMTGLTGINGAALAREGCSLTLVDTDPQRAEGVKALWCQLRLPKRVRVEVWEEGTPLQFPDRAFPFSFNFAALWHLRDPLGFLREMARVTSRHILIAMPNRLQLGFFLRKVWLQPEFFKTVDVRWTDMALVREWLGRFGFCLRDEGVLDVPPWPDTCVSAGELLSRLGLKRFGTPGVAGAWRWSILSYYRDGDPSTKRKVDRIRALGPESWPLPWRLKILWAHHRYLLAERKH